MTRIVVEREVAAPPATLWDVVADVGSWPRWTSSITAVELRDGELAPGRRVVITQPRLPAQAWTVTELQPGRSFTWSAGSPGITTVGTHEVHPRGEAASRVVLTLEQSGPLAPVVGLLLGRLSRRYVELEAAGLTAAAQSAAGG